MSSVLIIDDRPIVLQAWRRMLQDAGVSDIFDARDVASGYRLFLRRRPELVIVDLSMQGRGLGGLPLIKRMRAHDPRTRILVFSMHSDPMIAARALEAGANGYVLKDAFADELGVSYKTVVNMSSQLKQKLDARNLPDLIRLAVQLLSATPA